MGSNGSVIWYLVFLDLFEDLNNRLFATLMILEAILSVWIGFHNPLVGILVGTVLSIGTVLTLLVIEYFNWRRWLPSHNQDTPSYQTRTPHNQALAALALMRRKPGSVLAVETFFVVIRDSRIPLEDVGTDFEELVLTSKLSRQEITRRLYQ